MRRRHTKHETPRGLMNIGLNTRDANGDKELLGVAVVAICSFRCEPAI